MVDQSPRLIRLQKILADAGVASRRHAEELITSGRVTVDGRMVTELGSRADPERQDIRVDGERIRAEKKVYFAVNKPKGAVCTNRPQEGRIRAIDLVPQAPQRLYTVGRLDAASEGLILLTNDGELANRLAHPRYGIEKRYLAQVAGAISAAAIRRLRSGVWLDVGKVRPHSVRSRGRRGTSTMLEIVLTEGRNREIRRMLAALGHKVVNLKRIAVDGLVLGDLPTGKARQLTAEEVRRLQAVARKQGGRKKPRRRSRAPIRSK